MKIVSIFAKKLFAFHYSGNDENEYMRLLELWANVEYLFNFVIENEKDIGSSSVDSVVDNIIDDANYIDDFLIELSKSKIDKLDTFFKPLINSEYQLHILSLQKGRKNYLRLYALRIDANCFIITGGAIKFTHFMKDRSHTIKELQKLEKAQQYLKENNVFDSDSFFEFLNENYD